MRSNFRYIDQTIFF